MSSFTSNINLEKPGHGEYPNTWEVPVNSNMDIIDLLFGPAGHTHIGSGGNGPQINHHYLLSAGSIAHSAIETSVAGLWASVNYIRTNYCSAAPAPSSVVYAPVVFSDNCNFACGTHIGNQNYDVHTVPASGILPVYTDEAMVLAVPAVPLGGGNPVTAGSYAAAVKTQVPHDYIQRISMSITRFNIDGLSSGSGFTQCMMLMGTALSGASFPSRAGVYFTLTAYKDGSGTDKAVRRIVIINENAGPPTLVWEQYGLTTDILSGAHELSIDANGYIRYYYHKLLVYESIVSYSTELSALKTALETWGEPSFGAFGLAASWGVATDDTFDIELRWIHAASQGDESTPFTPSGYSYNLVSAAAVEQPGLCCTIASADVAVKNAVIGSRVNSDTNPNMVPGIDYKVLGCATVGGVPGITLREQVPGGITFSIPCAVKPAHWDPIFPVPNPVIPGVIEQGAGAWVHQIPAAQISALPAGIAGFVEGYDLTGWVMALPRGTEGGVRVGTSPTIFPSIPDNYITPTFFKVLGTDYDYWMFNLYVADGTADIITASPRYLWVEAACCRYMLGAIPVYNAVPVINSVTWYDLSGTAVTSVEAGNTYLFSLDCIGADASTNIWPEITSALTTTNAHVTLGNTVMTAQDTITGSAVVAFTGADTSFSLVLTNEDGKTGSYMVTSSIPPAAPYVTYIISSGCEGTGITADVYGQYFHASIAATYSGVTAVSLTRVNSTRLTIVVDNNSLPGTVAYITLTNPNQTSTDSAALYKTATYDTPTISNVTVSTSDSYQKARVIITGTNFVGRGITRVTTSSGLPVKIIAMTSTSITADIDLNVAPGTIENLTVSYGVGAGYSATYAAFVTVTSETTPVISSHTADLYRGNSGSATLTGTGFEPGCTLTVTPASGRVRLYNVEYVNSTSLTFDYVVAEDATIGSINLIVSNPGGTLGIYADSIVEMPFYLSTTAFDGSIAAGQQVTGTYTFENANSSIVCTMTTSPAGLVTILSQSISDDTMTVVASMSPTAAGATLLTVFNDVFTTVSADNQTILAIPAPVITAASFVDVVTVGVINAVTIIGYNFTNKTPSFTGAVLNATIVQTDSYARILATPSVLSPIQIHLTDAIGSIYTYTLA